MSLPQEGFRPRGRGQRGALQLLDKIGLSIAVFIIVSPAVLFFLWMASLSIKYEIDNSNR